MRIVVLLEVWSINRFTLDTCNLDIDMFEIFQVSSEHIREIYMEKNILDDWKLSNLARKGKYKFRRKTAVFGGSGGSTAVASYFHIVPLQNNCHVKSQSCNSLFNWISLTFIFGLKKLSLPPSPLFPVWLHILNIFIFIFAECYL